MLNQDWPSENYEIVIADDGSIDDTPEFVRSLASVHSNLHYVRQRHQGVTAARNLGLREARGEVISFLADDYELAPDYIRTAVRLLEENPAAMVVRFKVVAATDDLSGRVGELSYGLGILRRLVPDVPLNARRGSRFRAVADLVEQPTTQHNLEAAGGAVFRREVFDIVGLFDEMLPRSEDTDMGARLRNHGIDILYYPFHYIKHHYERFPDEALAKSYQTGLYRYRFHKKHRLNGGANVGKTLIALVWEKTEGMAGVVLHCYRAGRLRELLLHAPLLLLLETANKLGFCAAMWRDWRDVRACSVSR